VVDCRFDELTSESDLAIVVLACLRLIAQTPSSSNLAPLARAMRESATEMARLLDGVPAVDRQQALRTARRVVLGRLDRSWHRALELSEQVLADSAESAGGAATAEHVALAVPTDKLWEHILAEGLVRIPSLDSIRIGANNSLDGGVEVPSPWTSKGSHSSADRYPDFMAVAGGRMKSMVWCVDAKYKTPSSTSRPDVGDANQMFVYSHLARLHGKAPDRSALVYPVADVSTSGLSRELFRQPGLDHPLVVFAAPFPSKLQLSTRAAWNRYIDELSSAVQPMFDL
jgi:hypothetical protein